jgi:hypothetical protein
MGNSQPAGVAATTLPHDVSPQFATLHSHHHNNSSSGGVSGGAMLLDAIVNYAVVGTQAEPVMRLPQLIVWMGVYHLLQLLTRLVERRFTRATPRKTLVRPSPISVSRRPSISATAASADDPSLFEPLSAVSRPSTPTKPKRA